MATYSIIGFNKDMGQLLVRFHPDMSPVAVDVPIENGQYITGSALDAYIQGFIPVWHIERLETIKSGISNEASIEALVTPEPAPESTGTVTPSATTA